ncbi:MAG TPA: hypothetical protein VIH85_26150 [Solirubrobacteraceae bacterium]|jgi:hypothetical protein
MPTVPVELAMRRDDWSRHVTDLQTQTYEGAVGRGEREDIFLRAFRLTTPIALRALAGISATYLGGAGRTVVAPPRRVAAAELNGAMKTPTGGMLATWDLTWPALERARNRLTGEPLPPVQIFAIFPEDFTHPHLALCDLGRPRAWIANWPFQVLTLEDAARQEPVLAVIAEAELHERTFAGDLNWRLLDLN